MGCLLVGFNLLDDEDPPVLWGPDERGGGGGGCATACFTPMQSRLSPATEPAALTDPLSLSLSHTHTSSLSLSPSDARTHTHTHTHTRFFLSLHRSLTSSPSRSSFCTDALHFGTAPVVFSCYSGAVVSVTRAAHSTHKHPLCFGVGSKL